MIKPWSLKGSPLVSWQNSHVYDKSWPCTLNTGSEVDPINKTLLVVTDILLISFWQHTKHGHWFYVPNFWCSVPYIVIYNVHFYNFPFLFSCAKCLYYQFIVLVQKCGIFTSEHTGPLDSCTCTYNTEWTFPPGTI